MFMKLLGLPVSASQYVCFLFVFCLYPEFPSSCFDDVGDFFVCKLYWLYEICCILPVHYNFPYVAS